MVAILISLVSLGSLVTVAAQAAPLRNACESDDRQPSRTAPIGRLVNPQGRLSSNCTGTLISKSCVITAAHCEGNARELEFDVPSSTEAGARQRSAAEKIYPIMALVGQTYTNMQDWAVYRAGRNAVTGMLPGEVQGFLSTRAVSPVAGELVRITGYGMAPGLLNGTQQTSVGPVRGRERGLLVYRVDTESGNSGSAIILESTGEIIGIHTTGGCFSESDGNIRGNMGGLISEFPRLQDAIARCIAEE